jgi:Domain of unknown function (DUF4430)
MIWTAALVAVAAISHAPPSFAADKQAETVSLAVDFGDGAEVRFKALPWRDGMTVLDALAAAEKHPHGITFAKRGSGAMALITQIDDLKNQGNGKNWLYSVNGKTATVGAGAYKLKSGDAILWEFKVYEYN